jgi:hypothetical protein
LANIFFKKLLIPEDLIPQCSIYHSEVGTLALGDALSDSDLFDLFEQRGNEVGDLKFYVPEFITVRP